MKISIKIALFGMLAATGLAHAQSSKAEKATIKFEQKYAQAIAEYKNLDVKNQATNQMQQFFMVHKFYQVKTYKRLLKDYAKYQAAQDSSEKTLLDEFVGTIQMMRPEILGTILYNDFHTEYVLGYQKTGVINPSKYINKKQFVFVFSQKIQILADFIEKYKPYLSASLIVQMQELQKQFGDIKDSLIETYGLKFVQKHSQLNGFKYFCAALGYVLGIYVLLAPIVLLSWSISWVAPGVAGIGNVAMLYAVHALAFSIIGAIVMIPLGAVLTVYSIRYLKTYKNVRLAYKDWLEFVV